MESVPNVYGTTDSMSTSSETANIKINSGVSSSRVSQKQESHYMRMNRHNSSCMPGETYVNQQQMTCKKIDGDDTSKFYEMAEMHTDQHVYAAASDYDNINQR